MTFSLSGALASRGIVAAALRGPQPARMPSVIFPRIISVLSTPTLWRSLFSGFPCSSCFTLYALPRLSSQSLTQPLPLCPPLSFLSPLKSNQQVFIESEPSSLSLLFPDSVSS